jgi:hypothetical protein
MPVYEIVVTLSVDATDEQDAVIQANNRLQARSVDDFTHEINEIEEDS